MKQPDVGDTRYGIFLRPDARTCWSVIQLHLALKQQYGLTSAAAFAPHSTLVGNLATDLTVDQLADVVEEAIRGTPPVHVYNKGIVRDGDGWIYSINHDNTGAINTALHELAAAVKTAVLPISIPVEDYKVTPVLENPYWGHLSLASHELAVDPRHIEEIGQYLLELPISPAPAEFTADTVSLFEFHADWNAEWWRELRWTHLRSWKLS